MMVYEQIKQIGKEWRNVMGGRYPEFVFNQKPKELDFIPIFAYHCVDAEEFEDDLVFIKRNGYRTVTGEEYLRWFNGARGPWKRCVLLNFDDGMSSVFARGLPLLRKYGMHAMVFLVTGYMRESAKEEEPACRDELWNPLLCWEEVDEMKASDCFSFGSHTSFHHPIFASNDLVGFGHPQYNGILIDIPVEKGTEIEIVESDTNGFWGAPIYRHKHFMQARALYSNEPARNACVDYVQKKDSASFFRCTSWRRELIEIASHYESRGKMLKSAEICALILEDLVNSKKTIEERIGRKIHHLCYPYGAGSELSIILSKQAGFKTNIWQTLPYQSRNRMGGDSFRLVRLKKDFLRRMPGKGRRSLADIYWHKIRRRMEGNPYY